MKILVTGANGMLGQHLVKLLLERGYTVIATGKGPCRLPFGESENFRYVSADLVNGFALHETFETEKPEVVIHAAAMTQVDECETDPEKCHEVNVLATAHLVSEAEVCDSFFIYISTDFVFDGEKGDYREEDSQLPLSWYGNTKMVAESIVQTSNLSWSIVRTCLVFGNPVTGTRPNIITWVKNNLQEGKPIKVVSDQVRTPTYVEDLAKGIALVLEKRAGGVFHISGKDKLTPFDMAIATARLLLLDEQLIEKVDASVFSQPGRRPLKTGFDITKARQELGFDPLSFAVGLKRTLGVY